LLDSPHTIQTLFRPCLGCGGATTHHSGSFSSLSGARRRYHAPFRLFSSSFGARRGYHAPFRLLFVLVWGTADAPRIMQVLFHHSLGRGLPVHHLRLVLYNKNLLSMVYSAR